MSTDKYCHNARGTWVLYILLEAAESEEGIEPPKLCQGGPRAKLLTLDVTTRADGHPRHRGAGSWSVSVPA
jgi:hypothetical protein